MSSQDFTIRVRRFMTNVLLQRKQFHLEVVHPTLGTLPKTAIREQLGKIYKINDLNRIVVHSFTTAYGGGRTTGFGKIYDSVAAAKKFERNYQLARCGICPTKADAATAAGKPLVNRRAKKDTRTRRRKVRGTAKAKVGAAKK